MHTPGERDRHLEQLVARLDQRLNAEPVDLVVLPELSSIDYAANVLESLEQFAETRDGPSCRVFAELARRHRTAVMFGFPRRTSSGRYRISQAVADARGKLVAVYDKRHLAQFGASSERDYFEAGDHTTVVDIGGTRIGLLVCYDFRFPELARRLCMDEGADCLVHCVAFYRDESFPSWHHFAITRALENQVYLLSLNRAGAQWGGSIFCPPWMDSINQPQVFATDVELRVVELDEAALRQARETYPLREDLLKERR